MTEAELDYCHKLMAQTDAIISGLDPAIVNDAVNWGDLGCRAVEKVETLIGNGSTEIEWRVLIEEASPDADKFRALVTAELARRGYASVTVVTEW